MKLSVSGMWTLVLEEGETKENKWYCVRVVSHSNIAKRVEQNFNWPLEPCVGMISSCIKCASTAVCNLLIMILGSS